MMELSRSGWWLKILQVFSSLGDAAVLLLWAHLLSLGGEASVLSRLETSARCRSSKARADVHWVSPSPRVLEALLWGPVPASQPHHPPIPATGSAHVWCFVVLSGALQHFLERWGFFFAAGNAWHLYKQLC